MGIVGLPNVGKSTFFNILCKMNVAAENYPFCTIDPNLSRVVVPDERFDFLVSAFKTKSAIPAVLTVTDIAGLVKGAAEGAGLGNAFLSHIGAVDGIYHVCRAFESDDIVHVEGSVEPTRDLDIIHNELRKKDMAALASKMEPLRKQAERGGAANKEAKETFTMLSKFWAWLEEGKDIRLGDWSPAEVEELNTHMFLSAKPVIYLVNMSEKAYIAKKSKFLPALGDWLKARGTDDKMIPFSCEFEGKVRKRRRGSGGGGRRRRRREKAPRAGASAAPKPSPPPLFAQLAGMSEAEAAAYCESVGAKSALPRIIKTGYSALGLVHYFTASANEVRAWSVKKDTPAPKAAAVIHGDFEKHFISSDIYTFADFKELGSEANVRAAGKLRAEGRKYEVQDGDSACGGARAARAQRGPAQSSRKLRSSPAPFRPFVDSLLLEGRVLTPLSSVVISSSVVMVGGRMS